MKKHLSGIPSSGSWLLTFHVELSLTTIDLTVNNTIRPALCQYDKPDNSYSEQMKDELKKTILSLKPYYRDIIIAIDFEGYTYREISLETGIPEGTLMSRRHRAISLLYKKFETKKESIN